jgi:hypothetical protein
VTRLRAMPMAPREPTFGPGKQEKQFSSERCKFSSEPSTVVKHNYEYDIELQQLPGTT